MTRDDENPRDPGEVSDEQLSAFLDRELDAEAMDRVRAALDASPALARRLDQLRGVDEALRQLPAREVPGDLQARLAGRLAQEAAPEVRPAPASPRRPWRTPVLAAAAAAILALLLLPRLRPDPKEPEPPTFARQEPPSLLEPRLAPTGPAPSGKPLPNRRRPAPALSPEPVIDPVQRFLEGDPRELLARGADAPPTGPEIELALQLDDAADEDEDVEVIELLDWLGELGEIDRGGRG